MIKKNSHLMQDKETGEIYYGKFCASSESELDREFRSYLSGLSALLCDAPVPKEKLLAYDNEYFVFMHSFQYDEERELLFLNMVFIDENRLIKKCFTYSLKRTTKFLEELLKPIGFDYDELPLVVGETLTAKIVDGQIEDRLVFTGKANIDELVKYLMKHVRYPGRQSYDDIRYYNIDPEEWESLIWTGTWENEWDSSAQMKHTEKQ